MAFLQSRGRIMRMTPLARSYSTSLMRNTFWPRMPASPLPRSFGRTRNCTCGTGRPKIVKVFTSVR